MKLTKLEELCEEFTSELYALFPGRIDVTIGFEREVFLPLLQELVIQRHRRESDFHGVKSAEIHSSGGLDVKIKEIGS